LPGAARQRHRADHDDTGRPCLAPDDRSIPTTSPRVFGRGTALKLMVDSPTYEVADLGSVPYLDVSAVHDKDAKAVTFFIVNRHGKETLDLDVSLLEFGALEIIDDQVISHADLSITNTAEKPDNVVPVKVSGTAFAEGKLSAKIAPLSYRMIRLQA
jgi:alpha-N-arabinofuranosidase